MVCSNRVSIEPNAPNKSAKIPPGPVTKDSTPDEPKFFSRSSRINSIIIGSTGSLSIFSPAIAESSETLIKMASPSADGIGAIGVGAK